MMRVMIETVTPDMAEALLARNTNNRRMNPPTVDFYKDQIIRGQWRHNGETIKVAKSGLLLDGQHRLEAIRQSGKSMDVMIVRDLDEDVAITIDTGRPRRPADHLKIQGYTFDVNVLGAAAVVAMGFDKTGKYKPTSRKIAPWEIVGYVEKHRGLQESLERVPHSVGKLTSRSICVALHYIFSSYVGPTEAELFFDAFATGANLKVGSPILALRGRLLELKNQRFSASSSRQRTMLIYYFIQAFKAYVEKRQMRTMSYKDGNIPDLKEQL